MCVGHKFIHKIIKVCLSFPLNIRITIYGLTVVAFSV